MTEPRERDVELIREQIQAQGVEAYADTEGLRWQITLERLIKRLDGLQGDQ